LTEHGLDKAFSADYKKRTLISCYDSVLPLNAYHDSFVGLQASRFLESVSDEYPWHYFVNFVGPHNPWDAPAEYSSGYEAAKMPAARAIHDSLVGKPEAQVNRQREQGQGLTPEKLACIMRQYAAMITLIDGFIGRFLKTLEKRGLLDKTVVIYCADHGELMGDRGMFFKDLYYEAALRVPIILAGPGIEARGTSRALVHLFDLAPTCLELGNAPPLSKMHAKSLMPILSGRESEIHPWQISELQNSRMLFDGRYKFVENDGDL
jgi:arylsulfatase